ncbi:hypothetical protein [Azospirillum aestuarii]|uniref:hypothetical protein n=1 Tax=Azospirillum aestuarii TaxID=2802052 RepID=UPI00405534F8
MTMHRFRRSLKHWWQRGRRLVRYNRQASAGLGEEPIKEVPANHRVGRMIISYFFNRYCGRSSPFPAADRSFISVNPSGN